MKHCGGARLEVEHAVGEDAKTGHDHASFGHGAKGRGSGPRAELAVGWRRPSCQHVCQRAESFSGSCPETASVDSAHTPFAAISLMWPTRIPSAAGSSGRPATQKCSYSLLLLDVLWFLIQLLMTIDVETHRRGTEKSGLLHQGYRCVTQSSPRQTRTRRR